MTDVQRNKLFQQALTAQLRSQALLTRDTAASLLALLEQIKQQITLVLAAQPSDYQQWFLPQINRQIETVLQGLQHQGGSLLNTSLDTSASAGMTQLDVALRSAGVSLAGVAPIIDVQLLSNIKQFHVNRIKDITQRAASAIELELSKVLVGAQSPFDAQKAIQAILGSSPAHRITTIVRTSMAGIYDKTAHDRYNQAAEYLPGLQKRWYKSGKRHPRLSHVAAHLQTVATDKPFLIGGISMMHPHDPAAPASEVIRCGCTMRPYMASWDVISPVSKTNIAA